MYSWKTIRTLCTVVLLLPFFHLLYLVRDDIRTATTPGPEVWEDDLRRYLHEDEVNSLPETPVLFIGGRAIQLWPLLEQDLAPQQVLRRNLGSATVADLNHYYSRLVDHYRPAALVLLPGLSEFRVRADHSPEEVLAEVTTLVERSQSQAPDRPLYLFTPTPTLRFPSENNRIAQTGRLLKAWGARQRGVKILDTGALLSDDKGQPRSRYYRPNGVFLNEEGYAQLTSALQTAMGTPSAG
jgi:hypothetical protein